MNKIYEIDDLTYIKTDKHKVVEVGFGNGNIQIRITNPISLSYYFLQLLNLQLFGKVLEIIEKNKLEIDVEKHLAGITNDQLFHVITEDFYRNWIKIWDQEWKKYFDQEGIQNKVLLMLRIHEKIKGFSIYDFMKFHRHKADEALKIFRHRALIFIKDPYPLNARLIQESYNGLKSTINQDIEGFFRLVVRANLTAAIEALLPNGSNALREAMLELDRQISKEIENKKGGI